MCQVPYFFTVFFQLNLEIVDYIQFILVFYKLNNKLLDISVNFLPDKRSAVSIDFLLSLYLLTPSSLTHIGRKHIENKPEQRKPRQCMK